MNDLELNSCDSLAEVLAELDELVLEPNEAFDDIELEERFNLDSGGGNGGGAYC